MSFSQERHWVHWWHRHFSLCKDQDRISPASSLNRAEAIYSKVFIPFAVWFLTQQPTFILCMACYIQIRVLQSRVAKRMGSNSNAVLGHVFFCGECWGWLAARLLICLVDCIRVMTTCMYHKAAVHGIAFCKDWTLVAKWAGNSWLPLWGGTNTWPYAYEEQQMRTKQIQCDVNPYKWSWRWRQKHRAK